MAKAVEVGQVAEWFKATVLKTHAGQDAKPRNSRISNSFKPRMTRTERTPQRFAMAHMSAHVIRAGMTHQRHPALTKTQRICEMAKGVFITTPDGRKVYQRTGANRSWDTMKQRCTNPKHRAYKDYGGRGITVCDRWKLFRYFLEDMGERPEGTTLDRIDNNKGYYKENCRWATWYEQAWNRRGHADSSDSIKGVCFDNSTKRWQASARYMGKRYYLYHGPSKRAATKARRTFDNLVKKGITP